MESAMSLACNSVDSKWEWTSSYRRLSFIKIAYKNTPAQIFNMKTKYKGKGWGSLIYIFPRKTHPQWRIQALVHLLSWNSSLTLRPLEDPETVIYKVQETRDNQSTKSINWLIN